jgi:hypothetical protein
MNPYMMQESLAVLRLLAALTGTILAFAIAFCLF